MIHLGRFKHDSVGKWEMKHDELLMFLPTPGFQEYEKYIVIAKEIICHRTAEKTWEEVIPMSSNMYSFTAQASVNGINESVELPDTLGVFK